MCLFESEETCLSTSVCCIFRQKLASTVELKNLLIHSTDGSETVWIISWVLSNRADSNNWKTTIFESWTVGTPAPSDWLINEMIICLQPSLILRPVFLFFYWMFCEVKPGNFQLGLTVSFHSFPVIPTCERILSHLSPTLFFLQIYHTCTHIWAKGTGEQICDYNCQEAKKWQNVMWKDKQMIW